MRGRGGCQGPGWVLQWGWAHLFISHHQLQASPMPALDTVAPGGCEHQVLHLELSNSILGNEGQKALSSTGNGENNSRDICFPSQLITTGQNEFLNRC